MGKEQNKIIGRAPVAKRRKIETKKKKVIFFEVKRRQENGWKKKKTLTKEGKRKLNGNKKRAEIFKKEAKERKVIENERIFLSISKHDEEFYIKYFECRFYKNSNA